MTVSPSDLPGSPGQGGTAVRQMCDQDTKPSAALHVAHLPHGFFPKLGLRFVRQYHRTFIRSPHAVALAVGPPGDPDGILLGVLAPRDHYQWVLRRQGFRLALAGLVSLLGQPRLFAGFIRRRLPRYARALRSLAGSRSPSNGASHEAPAPVAAVLSHIVVDPRSQGGGTGARLVEAFVDEARRAGLQRVRATTLEGSDGAVRFYERVGWQRQSSSTNWDAETIVLFEQSTAADVTAA